MRPGGRLKAAIEVLDEIFHRHRPAALALSEWGKAHRFAGSGDRAAIGNLVYDVLRRRQSLAAQMGHDTTRALVLAAAPRALGLWPDDIIAAADGSEHAPLPLTADEREGLTRELPADTPLHIKADIPEWLAPSFERVFGDSAANEGQALAQRAPVDLRANALKADRDKALKALSRFNAGPTPMSPVGVRVPAPEGSGRTPNVEAETGHGKGWWEVQDEASQIAALLAGAGPRHQVLDLCAGAGGKTLAIAAGMQNTGQIYAYDRDRIQLRPIFERLKRAGSRNVQVLMAGDEKALRDLGPRFDVVFVDAPCTGSGVWRRRPDAKWRVKPQNLADRLKDQREALDLGAAMVKPGGRIVYVTCSVLPEENRDQITAFVERHPDFSVIPYRDRWRAVFDTEPPTSADGNDDTLLLTPARHSTDGFFIAQLERRA